MIAATAGVAAAASSGHADIAHKFQVRPKDPCARTVWRCFVRRQLCSLLCRVCPTCDTTSSLGPSRTTSSARTLASWAGWLTFQTPRTRTSRPPQVPRTLPTCLQGVRNRQQVLNQTVDFSGTPALGGVQGSTQVFCGRSLTKQAALTLRSVTSTDFYSARSHAKAWRECSGAVNNDPIVCLFCKFQDIAAAWTAGREVEKTETTGHDIGFMIFGSFGNGIVWGEQSARSRQSPSRCV